MRSTARKRLFRFVIISSAYLAIVGYIFLHRDLRIPPGTAPQIPTGTYRVSVDTEYQIPHVFRAGTLILEASPNGSYSLIDGKGEALPLKQGGDGLYFSENFSPVGAWILPGIARNWNEGRIVFRDNSLVVEGRMLEMGLMLFIVPFKDAIDWRLLLTKNTEHAGDG